jgi:regulator of sigma E protease
VRELGVFARSQRPADQGPMGIQIGVRAESYKLVYRSLPDAASESMRATARAAEGIITLPSKLISGQIEPSQARPVGPAGIAQLTGFALDASINQGVLFPLLQMAGVISIALGVTNLLPLPALDGGRLVFVLIEAVRGKRISPEKEAMVHFAGLMFLLALTLLITIQDVSNPLVNPF